jgi:hypothetical protein
MKSICVFCGSNLAERFVRPDNRQLVLDDGNAERLLDRMASYRAPEVTKWLRRDETQCGLG